MLDFPESVLPCRTLAAVCLVVSDSVQPQEWQPTRLPRPWDSPGKNTGVGCHVLLLEDRTLEGALLNSAGIKGTMPEQGGGRKFWYFQPGLEAVW